MDEAMEIVRGYGTGDWFSYQGRVFSLPAAKMSPVPAEQVPILVGGHSEAALRRAAMLGDGWLHGGGDAEELAHLLDRLRKIRHELSEQSGDIPRPSGDIPRGEREPAPETTEPEAGEFSSQTGGQEAAGAPRMPFEVHVISPDAFSVDGVRRLEEMGVTDVSVGFRWPYSPGPDRQSLTEKLDALRRYADDVISKVKP
jgi:alkanesulfonate monooxygenase SsuD/methylene tetrahydromethanopterin reductase-like flavin-dependent oxidoreductase (luciferase family)